MQKLATLCLFLSTLLTMSFTGNTSNKGSNGHRSGENGPVGLCQSEFLEILHFPQCRWMFLSGTLLSV